MKTVVTVNEPELVKKYAAEAQGANEVWLSYRDDQPPLRAKHPGDPRAALTPWLAHQVAFSLLASPTLLLWWPSLCCFVADSDAVSPERERERVCCWLWAVVQIVLGVL